MADDDDKLRINPGYPLHQLAKALTGAGGRAAERVRQWQQVIRGLFDGTLRVGSRTPVAFTPVWVTPEVVHGGFATGNFAAGGPLQPHELERLASLARRPKTGERTALNRHFAGDSGRAELEAMLAEGRFRVQVPEEGALLAAAWLTRRGEADRAAKVIATIGPFFDRLRFYPIPHPRPLRSGEDVFVQTAGDSVERLRKKKPQPSVERMNEAIRVWTPLYDRAVALFLETVEGEVPGFRRSDSGELVRGQNGHPVVAGGWPCRRYPEGWRARALKLLDEYRAARSQNQLCRKPEKPKENFARLRGYLEKCAGDPASLAGRDVGMIRKIIASFVTRHGVPGSGELQKTRAEQAHTAARPAHTTLAHLVADRLEQYPQDEGVPDLTGVLAPISGEPLPESIASKAMRCLEAPIGSLIEKRLVPSSEAMARVLPALASRARAAAIRDPELRRVYEAVYLAFRRRRSLLLLDLESQVKLGELPWIAAVEPWIGSDETSREAARGTLKHASVLAIGTFPQTLLPNKLVGEMRTLAAAAGLSLPLVDELACDIFMGAFSGTFLRAAKVAAQLLRGSLYERYFGLPFDRVLALDDVAKNDPGAPTSPGFAALCEELARVTAEERRSVARNGTIIEQAQILTTHNLAALFEELGLAKSLQLGELARRVFQWVCRRQQMKISYWRAQLQMMKNTAYAWRQMLFYLSLAGGAEVSAFATWSAAHLEEQRPDFRSRFEPVLAGLRAAIAGERFGPDGLHAASGGRRFLGWSVGRHWLLPPGNGS